MKIALRSRRSTPETTLDSARKDCLQTNLTQNVDPFSPHQTPELKEMVEQAYEAFDQHSAVSVAIYIGYSNGRSVPEMARQIADSSGRKGHVNQVKEEIRRHINMVEEDLEDALIQT